MKKIGFLIGILILLIGCGSESDSEKVVMQGDEETVKNIAEVIFTEKSQPDDFHEIGFHREESPGYTYLIKEATEQEQYEELWTYFRLQEEAPKVDMVKNNVMFFSLEESGTCPFDLKGKDIQLNPATKMLEVEVSYANSTDGACTTDATPRTFVLEVTKEANSFKNALIYDEGTETQVPIK